MEKKHLIIVEGAQGAGKTTITNALREQIPYTNLMRLSGIKDGNPLSVGALRLHELNLLKKSAPYINFILDRCYITEQVYARLGFKENFDKEYEVLNNELVKLSRFYHVTFIILIGNKESFKQRLLNREKAQHANVQFGVDNSIKQQSEYLRLFADMSWDIRFKDFNFIIKEVYDLNKPLEDTVLELVEAINNGK